VPASDADNDLHLTVLGRVVEPVLVAFRVAQELPDEYVVTRHRAQGGWGCGPVTAAWGEQAVSVQIVSAPGTQLALVLRVTGAATQFPVNIERLRAALQTATGREVRLAKAC
jgi:hypothetical protein